VKKRLLNFMLYTAAALVITTAVAASFWFYTWESIVGLLVLLLVVAGFYIWKFAKIVLILEDDLGSAIEALEDVEGSMQNIIDLKLFFDDPEVQKMVAGVMDSVKMAKFSVNKMIQSFTDRSKQKFIMVIEEDETEADQHSIMDEEIELVPTRRGEGTVLSVERSKV